MRPVNLTLEGFTSFSKRAEVAFSDMDLFAIVGQTGAGKSSLLDGMLFALFGKTPRGVGVNELRTQGAPAMKVQLEFAVGEKSYLVSRVYRGKAAIDFQFHERAANDWKLITSQVKQGEEEIERILGLDFDGFTRAVILPQGAFDEFLRGEPKQRTKILSDLLSLHVYQTMMQSANSRAANLKNQAELLNRQLERDFAGVTPEVRRDIERQIADVQNRLQSNRQAQDAITPLRQQAADLRLARQQRDRLRLEVEKAQRERDSREQAAAEVKRGLEEAVRRKTEAEAQLAQSGYDEAAYEQLVEVTPVARQVELLKSELAARRAKLKESGGPSNLGMSYEEARAKYGPHEVVTKLASDLAQSRVPEERERELEARAEEAERALDHLRAADLRAHLKAGEPCPVCEQIVQTLPRVDAGGTVEQARRARDEARRALEAFRHSLARYRELEKKAADLDAGPLDELAAQLKRLEETSRIDQEIKSISERLRAQSVELQKFPEWSAFPVEELEENLTRQRANRDRLQALRRQADEAAKAHIRALEQSAAVQADLLFLEKAIAEKQALSGSLTQQVKEAEQSIWPKLEALPPVAQGDELDRADRAARALNDEANVLRQSLGQLENRLETLIEKLERAAEIAVEVGAKTEQAQQYHELGVLLNAKNFIAYVQRQMLERLARLASGQLQTLSDGRYTLTLSNESNDFFVEDHWNARQARSAKTLSGGESFLASLSLALALSDSVAGFGQQSRLESLFLDEGFSTLDGEALQTAIEAVQLLASSRRMVGVISHLPQLAEQLPARILVDKSSSGSTVRLERGDHSHSMVAGGL
ncbi:MAG: SMC family ATPase [Bryobacteraceae bacterium]|nr:SMC family ATPase [Bryobacteraceae bacterium]